MKWIIPGLLNSFNLICKLHASLIPFADWRLNWMQASKHKHVIITVNFMNSETKLNVELRLSWICWIEFKLRVFWRIESIWINLQQQIHKPQFIHSSQDNSNAAQSINSFAVCCLFELVSRAKTETNSIQTGNELMIAAWN